MAESVLALKITENWRVTFVDFMRAIGSGAGVRYSIRICMKCFFPNVYWWFTRQRISRKL